MAAEGRPRVFPVYKKITTIGRAGGNDVCVDHTSVADYHAQVVFDGRDFNLNEVDRQADIQINGKKKRRGKIFHGDRLGFGEVELLFSLYDEGAVMSGGADEGDRGGSELAGMLKLSEFNRRLMEIRSVHEQMEALLDAVIEVTHAGKGFVLLLRDGETEVAAARNVDQQNITGGIRHLSDSIIKKVTETRKPLIVSDALNDDDVPRLQEHHEPQALERDLRAPARPRPAARPDLRRQRQRRDLFQEPTPATC